MINSSKFYEIKYQILEIFSIKFSGNFSIILFNVKGLPIISQNCHLIIVTIIKKKSRKHLKTYIKTATSALD